MSLVSVLQLITTLLVMLAILVLLFVSLVFALVKVSVLRVRAISANSAIVTNS